MISRRGQIWIETVIYTLIGLALIALVLSYMMPKINDLQDSSLVEQSISAMNTFNDKIVEVKNSPGSRKVISFNLKKGELFFDLANNEISLLLTDLSSPYSEVGSEIEVGKAKVKTIKNQKNYDVSILLNYPGINLTFAGSDNSRKISNAEIAYKFAITNEGIFNKKYNVDIRRI